MPWHARLLKYQAGRGFEILFVASLVLPPIEVASLRLLCRIIGCLECRPHALRNGGRSQLYVAKTSSEANERRAVLFHGGTLMQRACTLPDQNAADDARAVGRSMRSLRREIQWVPYRP